MTEMRKPITLIYDFKMGNDYVRRVYTATTYEDWHRVVRVLHENEEDYKVVKVER